LASGATGHLLDSSHLPNKKEEEKKKTKTTKKKPV